jgi:glycosyltransferase involved in cell wall biosynthesis
VTHLIYNCAVSKIPITVIILTKNEEIAISDCLNSVKNFAQVLVIDSNSTDGTVKLAKKQGSLVVNFSWNGIYPKKKQWALERPEIQNDWVLFLDADERVTRNLESEITELIRSNKVDDYAAIEIPVSYSFLGRELRHGHRVKKIALLNRRLCSFPEFDDLHVKNMWEVEGHYQPSFSGKLYRIDSKLIHDDPDGLYDYFARHNRYSDWESELKVRPSMSKNVRLNRTFQGRIFDRVPFKSIVFFFYSYFLRMGFRDGRAGFHYSVALSFYYWQTALKTQEKKNARFS